MNVVFLGGSLAWGAQSSDPQKTSYRALLSRKFEANYPNAHFRIYDASIGGTGSQLGAFRLERDVLAYKPDLVFLDFTVNDDPYPEPSPTRLAAYESLVRRLLESGAPVIQMILPTKCDVEPNPPPRPLDAKHKKIADAYNLPTADAVLLAKQRVASGATTPDELWDLPEDHTHPGDAGYALYAEAAWDAFQKAVAENASCRIPERMLHADTYMTLNRFRLAEQARLPAGWTKGMPHRNAVAYDFVCSRWLDSVAIARVGAKPLRFAVRGSNLLLFGEQTKTSGRYNVQIDDRDPEIFSAHCADGNMRLAQIIAEGLDPTLPHSVEIIPLLTNDEELRLESLCVAGSLASVKLATSIPTK